MYFGDEVELPPPRMEVPRGSGLALTQLHQASEDKLHPLARTEVVAWVSSNNSRFDVTEFLSSLKEINLLTALFF